MLCSMAMRKDCEINKKKSVNEHLLKTRQNVRRELNFGWNANAKLNSADLEKKSIPDKKPSALFRSNEFACKIVTSFSLSHSHHQNMCLGLKKQPTNNIRKGRGKNFHSSIVVSLWSCPQLSILSSPVEGLLKERVLAMPVALRASKIVKMGPEGHFNINIGWWISLRKTFGLGCTYISVSFTSR